MGVGDLGEIDFIPRAADGVAGVIKEAFAASLGESDRLVLVAASTLEMLSVLGQRERPSGVLRLDGLNVVGSSPDRRANPEVDSPCSAASVSSARQISSCFMMPPHNAKFAFI